MTIIWTLGLYKGLAIFAQSLDSTLYYSNTPIVLIGQCVRLFKSMIAIFVTTWGKCNDTIDVLSIKTWSRSVWLTWKDKKWEDKHTGTMLEYKFILDGEYYKAFEMWGNSYELM